MFKNLEGYIINEEVLLVLKNMKNNKSLGSDGFSIEFFKFFWKDFGCFLLRLVNVGFDVGEFLVI